MNVQRNFRYLPLVFCLAAGTAAAEIVTTSADQQALSLSIYNSDLALVRDVRRIDLPAGEQTLAFKEISARIQPETAMLQGGGLEVLEQNYEYDLLSPATLLQKYVGRTVTLVRENEATGAMTEEQARVLSAAEGVVLQIGDRIETEVDGRIVFPDVPANLRDKPTLTMVVDAASDAVEQLELSYLSRGLTWKADYVAELNEAENRVDLKGWVTLTNNSGNDYRNAKLQLVAGEVHLAEPEMAVMSMPAMDMAQARGAERQPKMRQESLFEYHLYSVGRTTTLLDNQSKQIALMQEEDGHCFKELVLQPGNQGYYWSRVGVIQEDEAVDVFLHMKNDKASNLGAPKPAGTMRVYKKDGSGFLQFIGEDAIDHTPENEVIKIRLGRAFDVTADRVQTDFTVVRAEEGKSRIHESAYDITLQNGKKEAVTVTVEENLPGDWKILEESQPHRKVSSTTAAWKVQVPAQGSTTLSYRVRQVMP